MPISQPSCTFDGNASEIRLRGVGPAVLTNPKATSAPIAASVDLSGATVNGEGPVVHLDSPLALEAVAPNDDGQEFDVTYTSSAPIRIEIERGGNTGELKDGRACLKWCPVVWRGQSKLVFLRLSADAQLGVPVALTEQFPYGKPPDSPPYPSLHSVILTGVQGRLVCPDVETAYAKGRLTWSGDKLSTLSVSPIAATPTGLHVGVTTSSEKESRPAFDDSTPSAPRANLSHTTAHVADTSGAPGSIARNSAVLATAGLVLGLAALFFVRRRRHLPSSRQLNAPVPEDGQRIARAPRRLFYSYSHADEELRDKLEKHLATFAREKLLEPWHDRRIAAGTEWKGKIADELDRAHLILLLISADFIASDYCYDVEMTRALERHRAREARVIPVILRACQWQGTPFGALQALPSGAKPVRNWNRLDDALDDVARGIRGALDELGE